MKRDSSKPADKSSPVFLPMEDLEKSSTVFVEEAEEAEESEESEESEEAEEAEEAEEKEILYIMDDMITAAEAAGFYSYENELEFQKKIQIDDSYIPSTKELVLNNVFNAEMTQLTNYFSECTADQIKEWDEILLPMAENGSLGARLLLAQKALSGCGTQKFIERTKQALEWMEAAAETWRHPTAFYCAYCLSSGLQQATASEDESISIFWLLKAAGAGHARAAFAVGMKYASPGQAQDFDRAAQFIRYANSLGYDPSTRVEIITHPNSIALHKARSMAKAVDTVALPALELEFGDQPYAYLLKHSNYIAKPQYL